MRGYFSPGDDRRSGVGTDGPEAFDEWYDMVRLDEVDNGGRWREMDLDALRPVGKGNREEDGEASATKLSGSRLRDRYWLDDSPSSPSAIVNPRT